MKLGFGRVVPATVRDEPTTRPLAPSAPRAVVPRGRVAPRAVVNAAESARAIVSRAEERAEEIVRRAEAEAAELRLHAEALGRADAAASIAARALALALREGQELDRSLDRVIELARVLSERLLGEELRLDPARVVALARRAIDEARGARRVRIAAHPEDAPLLEEGLRALSAGAFTEVVADPARARGSLRLETDIGVLDADIAPQLDRLLPKLRESLGHG